VPAAINGRKIKISKISNKRPFKSYAKFNNIISKIIIIDEQININNANIQKSEREVLLKKSLYFFKQLLIADFKLSIKNVVYFKISN
jgi:hypothetical protein